VGGGGEIGGGKGKGAPVKKVKGGGVSAEDLTNTGGDVGAPMTSLFVKNLSFGTTDAGFLKHFRAAAQKAGGAVKTARVARKKSKTGETLSRGFGFVELGERAVAEKVMKELQGSVLDGHQLVLQLSKGQGGASAATGDDKVPAGLSKTRLVIRNVAFEATKKELMGLCSPFGHVKDLRIPRKFDGTHRGFAFVEFSTKQEAQTALDSLGSTHFYGRHLVVERAKETEGLEEVRERTAAKFERREHAEAGGVRQRKKLRVE